MLSEETIGKIPSGDEINAGEVAREARNWPEMNRLVGGIKNLTQADVQALVHHPEGDIQRRTGEAVGIVTVAKRTQARRETNPWRAHRLLEEALTLEKQLVSPQLLQMLAGVHGNHEGKKNTYDFFIELISGKAQSCFILAEITGNMSYWRAGIQTLDGLLALLQGKMEAVPEKMGQLNVTSEQIVSEDPTAMPLVNFRRVRALHQKGWETLEELNQAYQVAFTVSSEKMPDGGRRNANRARTIAQWQYEAAVREGNRDMAAAVSGDLSKINMSVVEPKGGLKEKVLLLSRKLARPFISPQRKKRITNLAKEVIMVSLPNS